ncbi:lipopeptide [Sneathiella chinensis]|uniref:Lipoprotein n=1 Tax=Sneathiella chinensis TaxID=349750 RepID=A0ABQ5U0T9_9PROT|nr:lipopeptide [Sneathiella chinensis]GLQ05285.1 hypothetical protein GCM10007924_05060 [Sneathiella chinensis]
MKKMILSLVAVTLLAGGVAACGKKSAPVYKKPAEQTQTKTKLQ